MTRVIVGDMKTGRRWTDLPFMDLRWSSRLGTYDTIEATVTLADPDIATLDLISAAAVGKSFLGVVEFDVFMAAGPVWGLDWDADKNELTISASGWETYWSCRIILPPAAANQSAYPIILPEGTAPIVVGPDDTREAGDSNPALDTTFTGYDLGTIYSKVAQQALAWPGSPGIFVFPPDVPGTHTKTWLASSLKTVYDAQRDVSALEGGPEIVWLTRWTPDHLGIEVLYRAGTESEPRLFSPQSPRWDMSVDESPITGLKIGVSGSKMASQSWVNGGRSVNKALVRRGYDSTLIDQGYALMEIVDSHPTASEVGTLDKYAAELARVGSAASQFWSFRVKTTTSPRPDEFAKGDFTTVIMPRDGFVPGGSENPYSRRIVGLAGSEEDEITVTTAEVIG